MEQTSQSSSGTRILTWGIFIVIVGLVVWGLIVAQQKAAKDAANIVLPNQIVETDHIRGSSVAPVTMVEYGDFQCPACGAYHPIVEQVIKDVGPDKLRFVFRHFPLPQHGNAIPAAKAAEAAGLQGKFWEMYNLLYERQATWEKATEPKTVFTGYAKEMGLDTEKFSADFELKSIADHIDNDYKGGVKAGINATPTFFINGKQVTGPSGYDEFKKLINNALPKQTL
jgi:protein-disulfide isomerase